MDELKLYHSERKLYEECPEARDVLERLSRVRADRDRLEERGPLTESRAIRALGYISAELAGRADAWNGNAPDWFPEPPEWLDLWEKALVATAEEPVQA